MTRALHSLARYARRRVEPARVQPSCELCCAPLGEGERHDHVVDLERHTLRCACRACALLFESSGAGQGRYKRVPDRVRVDPHFDLAPEDWDALNIPVRLAFVFRSTPAERLVAVYPGAAGAIESEPPEAAWDSLCAAHPWLRAMQPDVEALLLHAPFDAPAQAFGVPIDVCYALVALVRRHHRGFDGGAEFRDALATFFEDLRARARPVRGGSS